MVERVEAYARDWYKRVLGGSAEVAHPVSCRPRCSVPRL